MANPTPHWIPVAVVGDDRGAHGRAFIEGMEKALAASVRVHRYGDRAAALRAVNEQKVYAILLIRDSGTRIDLEAAGASGATVAQFLEQAAPRVGEATGVAVAVRDIKPHQRGDPRGLAVFYITLAAVIVGLVGAAQLGVHAKALTPAGRIAFTAVYALLGGFAIAAAVDWVLGALRLPFAESWAILGLTMFTSGMVFNMFSVLVGRWALVPAWGLMVVLGNPSSGGAVSWALLPSPLASIGRWLPPGASVNAQHTAIYFRDHQHAFPFLVLGGWALTAVVVFWFLRHRASGGRDDRAVRAPA
ncbi:UNVERIFIED_ORG: hypothetical protein CLV66_104246 [Actinomadura viridilutea]